MLILNIRELEERLTNEWEEVVSSIDTAQRLNIHYEEPSSHDPGLWLWTDKNGYHFLMRDDDGVELTRDTESFSEVEFILFSGPITEIARTMTGDFSHNVNELSKSISRTFQNKMGTMLNEQESYSTSDGFMYHDVTEMV